MLTTTPQVSERVRKYMLDLAADPSRIVARIHTLLTEQEEAYSRLPPAATQDVLGFITHCATLWFRTLGGASVAQAEWDVLEQVGRRRMHQGVPLPSVLRGFRFGGQAIWQACVELPDASLKERDELLFSVSGFVLQLFDAMSQAVSQAYLDEQHKRARWRDSLLYELTSIIFQFPNDAEGFHKTAEALGLDPSVPRIALALQTTLPSGHTSKIDADLDRLVLAVSRRLKVTPDELVRVLHRGRLVMWVPSVRGETVVSADRRIVEAALQLIKTLPEVVGIGVGLMNQGPAGWAMSVDEATKALEFGQRTQSTKGVQAYSEISVNESVRRTDNVLRYLNSLLERLTAEPELLATLQTYFDHRQHRRLSADALGIHPNTLNHRLERIETILGANLEDAGWIAKLHIVLKLRQ